MSPERSPWRYTARVGKSYMTDERRCGRCTHSANAHVNGVCVAGRNDADGTDWMCYCRTFLSPSTTGATTA